MNKAELIRHEIEKRKEHNLAIGNPLFSAMAEEDIELLSFIDSLQENSVSEELEEAEKEWLKPQLDKSYADYGETKMMELTHFDGYAMLDAIEFGAQWQQKKDSIPAEYLEELINKLSKQFPEVSFAKLSRIAVRVAKWQKE